MSTVKVEHRDDLLLVTIDRPAVRNAVDRPTAEALSQAFREFDLDPALKVAVLTGAGGQFCAGADLKAIASGTGNRVLEVGDGPVIAAVEGHAVAGGLELAIWCDLRVAARDAVFGVYCRRFGVPLIDGGTIRLPRLIGHSRALDMILTGRAVAADEALQMGLCNRVCEPGDAVTTALTLARTLADFPHRCMRADRASAYQQWDLPLDVALLEETRRGLAVITSGETLAGAARFTGGQGRHGSGT